MRIALLSVNVAMPSTLGQWQGEAVISGIAKSPLTGTSVFVGSTNIAGDGQADLSVHGGPDKAVYAYPAIHWPWWESEKQLTCKPGRFGENLTLDGPDETAIAIGDRFQWGDAVLEVSQPRAPCYKFVLYTGRADAAQAMTASARSGWYLRVLRQGEAPIAGTLERIHESGGPSVHDAFAALFARAEPELLDRVYAAPGLAEAWRAPVGRRRKTASD